jgi:molybdenum ABC transporter molybdate-binding protein
MPTRRSLLVLAATAALVAAAPVRAQDKSIVVSSTTSTQDSGLFGYILPLFKAKTGIDVKVVAQGTGQALDTGRRGDADVVFVHAKPLEEKFVADGAGVKRHPVMYNDFILVGPKSDPAGIKGMTDIAEALKAIKAKGAPFISRGDRSGTHVAELELWKAAVIDIAKDKGPWYKEIGQGMGAALNTASAANAYVLTDRGTWLSFKNRGDVDILLAGDKRPVQPVRRHPGQSGKASAREEGSRPGLHRLARLARRAEGDRGLQDQRAATVLPQCDRAGGVMLVRFALVLSAATMTSPAIASDPVFLHAAGSLRGALTEVAGAFEAASAQRVQAKYGPSGTLKDEIAAGARAEVFASANMEHPQALATAGKSGPVVLFARNRLCALVRPGLAVESTTLLAHMLEPGVKLATSTPRADPSGDYAWEMFRKADKLKPGAFAALERKARQLTGGPNAPVAPAGYGMLVAAGRADIFITYCTGALEAQRQNAGQRMVALPDELAVGADYGLTMVNRASPQAYQFAMFILSVDGQRVLARHGFAAPSLPP